MTQENPDYPHFSPENVRLSSLMWAAAVGVEGSPARLLSAWLSLLHTPGAVTKHRGRDFKQLVLKVCRGGFLSLRVRFKTWQGHHVVEPVHDNDSMILVDMVESMEDWKCLDVHCRPPCWEGWPQPVAHSTLKLVSAGNDSSLLKFAAMTGFKNLNKPDLVKLKTELRLPGRKDIAVAKLVLQLMQHVFPDKDPEFYERALETRFGVGRADDVVQERYMEDALAMIAESMDDDGYADEVKKWKEATEKAAKRHKEWKESARAAVRGEEAGGDCPDEEAPVQVPSSSSSSGLPRPEELAPVQWRTDRGLTLHEARRYAPPSGNLRKDETRHMRWQFRAPWALQIYSKSWGPLSTFDDNEALCHVLVMAWRDFEAFAGVKCPWEFDKFRLA